MGLHAGTKLGPYEIVTLIGAGGMGEVYKARDPRVGRDVAIKISAQQFSERFRREARVIASLNHPNICTLHDVGPDYLVMEFVDGPTLADRSKQGPIPLEEALGIAKQIADGLEAAHEKGVIHRDLKPANIKIRPDGMVKVLDFGLAKVAEPSGTQADPNNSPTFTDLTVTRTGEIFGTAAYMSPEQARGKSVDKRADIWAFGVVLYEMLTGRRLFQGETVSDTLAAVLRAEPEWDRIPAGIRPLLRRCLERDPKRRLHDIADARLWLEDEGEPTSAAAATSSRFGHRLGWLAAGAVFVAAIVLGFMYFRQAPAAAAEPIRFEIWPPEKVTLSDVFSVSPDGRKLAFIARSDRPRIWIRSLETLEARPLTGTEDVNGAIFWSPDSRAVAYSALGNLRKIEAAGGPSQTVCETTYALTGGFWSSDGKIVFGIAQRRGLFQVSSGGGAPTQLTVDGSNPSPLPDGRNFVYTRDVASGGGGIYVGSLDFKPEEQGKNKLLPDETQSIYAADPNSGSHAGRLLFLRAGALMAQGFDPQRLEIVGEPVVVAERVVSSVTLLAGGAVAFAAFSASDAGVLVYRTDRLNNPNSLPGQASQFTWFDRQGKVLGTVGEPGAYFQFALSPDAKRIAAVQLLPPGPPSYDIFLLEMAGGMRSTRLTLDPAPDIWPLWSPDGNRIVFTSQRDTGRMRLYQKASSGAGGEDLLYSSPQEDLRPTSWSPDGRFVLLWSSGNATKTGNDVWVLPLDSGTGSGTGQLKAFPFLRTEFGELDARFSPDGRWISYTSNESANQQEVYVRPFDPSKAAAGSPLSESKWLVSKGGGRNAHWRKDGKELFYIAPDNNIMAVDISTSGTAVNPVFIRGVPKVLFKAQPVSLFWEVSPDGNKFLIPIVVSDNSSAPYKVVLNWTATLKR